MKKKEDGSNVHGKGKGSDVGTFKMGSTLDKIGQSSGFFYKGKWQEYCRMY